MLKTDSLAKALLWGVFSFVVNGYELLKELGVEYDAIDGIVRDGKVAGLGRHIEKMFSDPADRDGEWKSLVAAYTFPDGVVSTTYREIGTSFFQRRSEWRDAVTPALPVDEVMYPQSASYLPIRRTPGPGEVLYYPKGQNAT